MTLQRFFSLGIGKTKVHCIAMVSIRSVAQQHSNSHFFSIPFPFFWHFSLRRLPTIPFSECVFFWNFSLQSLPTLPFLRIPILFVTEIFLCEDYRFQKTSQTSDAQKNTPFFFRSKHKTSFKNLPSLPPSESLPYWFQGNFCNFRLF